MAKFEKALVYKTKNEIIPQEDDFWGKIIGDWDTKFIYAKTVYPDTYMVGEWHFSRILQGMAIQDVYIFPSRDECMKNNIAIGEYGTTLRIYNPESKTWFVSYGANGEMLNFTAKKVKKDIVLTEVTKGELVWIFTNIKRSEFTWRSVRYENGKEVEVYAEVEATRHHNKKQV